MDEQTDSSTPGETDRSCFQKARANGEETFSLRSQDITAPLVIDFWVKVNQKVRAHLRCGLTLEAAVAAVRSHYFMEPEVDANDKKLARACAIAGKMEKWMNRRLAD